MTLGHRDTFQQELTTLAICHSSSTTRDWHCLWLEWEEGFYKAGFLDPLSGLWRQGAAAVWKAACRPLLLKVPLELSSSSALQAASEIMT